MIVILIVNLMMIHGVYHRSLLWRTNGSFCPTFFADSRPDVIPDFNGGAVGGAISADVLQFSSPHEVFTYYFDSVVIDQLCFWMNEKAADYRNIYHFSSSSSSDIGYFSSSSSSSSSM